MLPSGRAQSRPHLIHHSPPSVAQAQAPPREVSSNLPSRPGPICTRRSFVDLVLGTGDRAVAPGVQTASTVISVQMESCRRGGLRIASWPSCARSRRRRLIRFRSVRRGPTSSAHRDPVTTASISSLSLAAPVRCHEACFPPPAWGRDPMSGPFLPYRLRLRLGFV